MKKLLSLLVLLIVTVILPISSCEAAVEASRSFLTDFIGGEWKGGKVSYEQHILNFHGLKSDGNVDITFYKNQNGKTDFNVWKDGHIIWYHEFPALYGISVKHIQEIYTGKSFFIVSVGYDTSYGDYLVMGYDEGKWYVYVNSKDFYDPLQSDYTSLDVENSSLQLVFGEMGTRNTRKQIYELGYNLDTRNFAYIDKGITRN